MTLNKETKRVKRPINNSQTPAGANETMNKYHRFLKLTEVNPSLCGRGPYA